MHVLNSKLDICIIYCMAIAIRAMLSLWPYSGANKPPLYGDYEAQRHWQEITYNLKPSEWYRNNTNNDLSYWGLDYPPLTAYHSYIIGKTAAHLNPSYVGLKRSRGFETEQHKTFMRLTVLIADAVLFLPASFLIAKTIALRTKRLSEFLPTFLCLTLYPGEILIDNGHFQYNNISLALYLLSLYSILHRSHYWASLFFTLAINYKQMELYHAMPIFIYFLAVCYNEFRLRKNIWKFFNISGIVILTFLTLWFPWIYSWKSFTNVLRRLFPFYRGVFEDKVANFWCSLNILIKIRSWISIVYMALICLLFTLTANIPILYNLFNNNYVHTLLLSLSNSSLAFFLFSFQVHEKSILLAAIPIACNYPYQSFIVICFLKISTFSLLPLLIRDKLFLPYLSLKLLFNLIMKFIAQPMYESSDRRNLSYFMIMLDISIYILSFMAFMIKAPLRYPDLWTVIIYLFCSLFFMLIFLVNTLAQLDTSSYALYSGNSLRIKIYKSLFNKLLKMPLSKQKDLIKI